MNKNPQVHKESKIVNNEQHTDRTVRVQVSWMDLHLTALWSDHTPQHTTFKQNPFNSAALLDFQSVSDRTDQIINLGFPAWLEP